MPAFLHVGCGRARREQTTIGPAHPDWTEVRLDIDPAWQPDLIGSMTQMDAVADASMDAIYSSHNIEHLYPHEVPLALKEFRRVLRPEGFAVITCPDLQACAEAVLADRLTEPMHPDFPIPAMDVIFGDHWAIAEGWTFMAHRCGFTLKHLYATLRLCGFPSVRALRRGAPYFDLWAVACNARRPADELEQLAARYLPVAGAAASG